MTRLMLYACVAGTTDGVPLRNASKNAFDSRSKYTGLPISAMSGEYSVFFVAQISGKLVSCHSVQPSGWSPLPAS